MKFNVNAETIKLIEKIKWLAADVLDGCGDAFAIEIEHFDDRRIDVGARVLVSVGTDTTRPIVFCAPLGHDVNHALRAVIAELHADARRLLDLAVRRERTANGFGWLYLTARSGSPVLAHVGGNRARLNAGKLNTIAHRLGVYTVPTALDLAFDRAVDVAAAGGAS